MNFIKRLQETPFVKRIVRRLPQQPIQEKVDVYRASLLLKCNDVCNKSTDGVPTADDVHKFSNEVDALSHDEQMNFVHDQVNSQLRKMFTSLVKCDDMRNEHHSNVSGAVLDRKEAAMLLEDMQYTVSCKPSLVQHGGDGVFVAATKGVFPGTVVCLYPGLVHLKEYLRDRSYFSALLPDDDFMLMARLDEALIDGRSAHAVQRNPYALAHKVNHCGSSRKPNVMQVAFDFPSSLVSSGGFPEQLRRYIPNKYAKEPSLIGRLAIGPMTLMPSVVLLTTRHLRDGDELLMDYRLDPESKSLPSWYEPYDVEEARNRWANPSEAVPTTTAAVATPQ